jgi:DNA-binding PadR family transcriptional regulator
MRGYLAEFEQLVLLAALRLGSAASALNILDEIEARTGRAPAFGSIYVTLDRLEDKGLLRSRFEEGDSGRSGRARRYVTPTAAGMAALRESKRALRSMWEGLDGKLGNV